MTAREMNVVVEALPDYAERTRVAREAVQAMDDFGSWLEERVGPCELHIVRGVDRSEVSFFVTPLECGI